MEEGKKRLRLRAPSPALVVAIIALVFAMTGTGLAASKLVRGDSLIKKNSLSGNRLKVTSMPGARVYNVGTQAIPTNSSTALTFSNADYNVGGVWDLADPTRLTAKVAGRYSVTASISWANDPVGNRTLMIQVNGTTTVMAVTTGSMPTETAPQQNCATTVRLMKGDYVRALVWQTSGDTLDSWNDAHDAPTLSLDWIAP